MPVQSFYPSFTLRARDADGWMDELPNETLTIKNAADNSTITTVESDDFGFVADGLLASVPPGTEIYFEHATYPNTLPITTTETANAAYYVNPVLTFLVQDLFTEEIEPDTVEVWMKDGDAPYIKIGEAAIGQTVKFPYESFYEKDLDFRLTPIVEGMTQNVKRLEDMPSESLNVSPLSDSLTFEYTQINNFPTLHLAGRTTALTGALEAIQPTNKFTLSGLSLDINESNLTLGNIGGTLGIAKGGTGQTTANAALNAFLPTQTGQSGKFLTTDGSNTSWASAGGGIVIGTTGITSGTNDRILYQAGGVVQESANLQFDGNDLILGKNLKLPSTGASAGQILINSVRTLHAYGTGNLFFGGNSGNLTLTGTYNSGVGDSVLQNLTSGTANFAGGAFALRNLTSGSGNAAFGYEAGMKTTTGNSNFFLGGSSGHENTSGGSNVYVGASAGYSNVSGNYNIGVGSGALQNNTGSGNTVVGSVALYYKTSGDYNTAVGYGAGENNATGAYNVFLGFQAGNAELGSNKLYISNSATATPLIYGEFDNGVLKLHSGSSVRFHYNATGIAFFGATPVAQPTVTGSRGGNAALQSLLTQLAALGLIVDSTS